MKQNTYWACLFLIFLILANTNVLTAINRYDIIEGISRPEKSFVYPYHEEGKTNKRRCFRNVWLEQNNWLVYSEHLDGGLCLPCVLFAKPGHRQTGTLVTRPLTKFKDATRDLLSHGECDYHRNSVMDMTSFLDTMEQQHLNVAQQMDTAVGKRIEGNRQKLSSIMKTIILCGRQNFALRGHRDDATCTDSGNPGNFRALLNFRVDSGDKILETHLKNAPKNATYISKTVQNELIELTGDHIRSSVVNEAKQAGLFSVMADETTDISNQEQMSLCLRYVLNGTIHEQFVDFVACNDGVTGAALAQQILRKLRIYGLDLSLLRGQGYHRITTGDPK